MALLRLHYATLLGALLAALTASSARAATIEYVGTAFGDPGDTLHFELPQFDPSAFPELVSVQVRIRPHVEFMGVRAQNNGTTRGVGRALIERSAAFSGPGIAGSFDFAPALASNVSVGAGSSFDYTDEYFAQFFPDVTPSSIVPYVGTGLVAFDVTVGDALSIGSSNPNFTVSLLDEGVATARVRVIYTYVPEPGTALLLGGGLLALGAVRRRR